jgi:hypothetical protein
MSQEIEKTITSLDQVQVVQKGPLTVWQLLPGRESPQRSISALLLNGENHQVKNTESDAIYMILGGVGYFTVWDGGCPTTRIVRTGDCVRIPAGALYKDVGADLFMIAMNRPAFDANKVVVLD